MGHLATEVGSCSAKLFLYERGGRPWAKEWGLLVFEQVTWHSDTVGTMHFSVILGYSLNWYSTYHIPSNYSTGCLDLFLSMC